MEWVRAKVNAGEASRIALVAKTPSDVRDVMIEGESGIIAISPPDERPRYEPSKRKLVWPNGAFALAFSSYEPDLLRGPQFDLAACDELAAWKYAQESWDNLMLALRLGNNPQVGASTTPKPVKLLKQIKAMRGTVITRGTTYENRSNLPPAFYQQIVDKYEGTRTGRQEIYAEDLEEAEFALWTRDNIELTRRTEHPEMTRVIVAIDPAVSSNDNSDETGIVAVGRGEDGHGYVLEDASGRYSPDGWARSAVDVYYKRQADRIVAEVNNGGDMVELTLRTFDSNVPYMAVHASRGKRARAEPIAALYEQGKIHHVGMFPELEDQLTGWEPNSNARSPDRLDALVWGLSELMLDGEPSVRFL